MNYSFIIPHKNVPHLLQLLLDSIPIRNDTEVIIVDDHSDKNLVDFEHFPGFNRPNTKCIFLDESRSAGHARNVGMEMAVGKWLLFADADDSYTDKINYVLDKYASDEQTDMVLLNARMVDGAGREYPMRTNMYIDNYLKGRFYSEKVVRFQMWTPWSRMVKREMVLMNDLHYEEIPVGNDMMFCLNCSRYAKKIEVEGVVVYNYLKPIGRSLTNAYSLTIQSLDSKVARSFRRLALYKEVHYAFKPNHLLKRYKALRNKKLGKEYVKRYNELLKEQHYSNIIDAWYYLVLAFGRFLKIV